MTEQEIDWQRIARDLAAPFDPTDVDWRPQGKPSPNARVQLVPYIDARCVQERLDAVVGLGGWDFDWQPLNMDAKGEVTSAKGILTIHGLSKADVGTASNFEPSKGCVSDALKRAAVMWGVGRYIYALPQVWVTLDAKGHVTEEMMAKLRDGLRRHAQGTQESAPATHQPATKPATAKQLNEVAAGCAALGKPLIEITSFDHAEKVLRDLRSEWARTHPKTGQAAPAEQPAVEHDLRELGTGGYARN